MKNLFKTLSPKRLIAGALACLMLGSLLIPAFAEDQPSGGTCLPISLK